MYEAEFNKNGTMKHSQECKAAFGRKDDQCPRCVEMLNGSPARSGWQQDHFQAIKPVNTYGTYCSEKKPEGYISPSIFSYKI